MYIVLLALAVFIGLMLLYAIYNCIWYTVKLISLRTKIGKLTSGEVSVKFTRPFYKVIFGQKGKTNFAVFTKHEKIAVSIISFLSTRGRWNIEKTRNERFYIEARMYNKIFFNNYVNTGTEPEHSKDYRRESRFQRCRLYLPLTEETGCDKHILLMFPRPKLLTYTDTRLEYLNSGDTLCDYTIMYADDLFDYIQRKK